MNIQELQQQAADVFLSNLKRDGIEGSETYFALKLTEELGEFVQAYLIHSKQCRPVKYRETEESHRELSKELADVLGIVFVLAQTMHIDLEEALVKKWITREWVKS